MIFGSSISCVIIEDTITSIHTIIFFFRICFITSLALTQENWKKKKKKKKISHQTLHKKFFFTWFHKSMTNILWRIVGLFLPWTTEILDFLVSLSTLLAVDGFSQNCDFAMIIMPDFSSTKESTIIWRWYL